MIIKELLTEKLRPKQISQLILPTRVKNIISSLDQELNQNILLYGGPGTGKSSVSKILASNYDNLYLNISDESSVETVRTKIIDFCKNRSIDQKSDIKVVILDEAEYGSANFFASLRATIETYSKYTRFIATCNNINKIPAEIKSRLTPINFDSIDNNEKNELKDKWVSTLKIILSKFNIKYDSITLNHLIETNFPDFRRTLNKIQELKNSGSTDLLSLITSNEIDEQYVELYKLILFSNNDTIKNYQFIISKYSKNSDACLEKLGNQFIDFIIKEYPSKGILINKVLIKVAEYQYKRSFVMDKAVNLVALVFELCNLFGENK